MNNTQPTTPPVTAEEVFKSIHGEGMTDKGWNEYVSNEIGKELYESILAAMEAYKATPAPAGYSYEQVREIAVQFARFADGSQNHRKYFDQWASSDIGQSLLSREGEAAPQRVCPDCDVKVSFQHQFSTDRYGLLSYFSCPSCKETWVCKNGGDLAIAAP